MATIDCLILRRLDIKGIWQYMILNGINMGRWTYMYGVNCLADTYDCKEFAKNQNINKSELIIVKLEVPNGDNS